MRFTATAIAILWIAACTAGCDCAKRQRSEPRRRKAAPPGAGTVLDMLPADDEVEGWVRAGRPRRFVGHDLYGPIDGAADAFFQFGFKEAAFVMYRGPSSLLDVQIHRMASPDDACGIASSREDVDDEFFALKGGGQAVRSGARMHFAKGPYYVVSFQAMHGRPEEVRRGMLELSEAVAAKIEEPYHTPDVLSLMPEGHLTGGVHYFRTPMTQGNLFYITYENVLGLRAETFGVAAYYDTIDTEAGTKAARNALFVITYPSPEDAPRIFREAAETLGKEPFQVFGARSEANALLTVQKDGRTFLKLGCEGSVLYGAWDIADEERVDALLVELAARIRQAQRNEDTP